MKIAIIGGGPAGLYFARLRKLHHPSDHITVYEQNPAGRTFGFGVSIADKAVGRYGAADPVLAQRIASATVPLPDQRISIDAQNYCLTSTQSGAGIARQNLLNIMAEACLEVGVAIEYNARIDMPNVLNAHDLVVGADGANSVVLTNAVDYFAPSYGLLTTRFAWYGVARSLPEAGLSFKRKGPWRFVGHYYPYTDQLSTFVAEVDGSTWDGGFSDLSDTERKQLFEDVFADELQGQRLVENRSIWRQFRFVDNAHWACGKQVLLGDALSVAHYSIGSGTRLAMDDALALFDAFEAAHDDVLDALALYEATRRPVREKLMNAARRSWDWYEGFRQHMELPLLDFIYAFMTRTGRIDDERLARAVPTFAADYAAYRASLGEVALPQS